LLEDLKSTNGSFVNGQKTDKQLLSAGDRIKVGSFELEFETHAKDSIRPARLEEQLETLKSGDPEAKKSAVEFLVGSGYQAANHLVPKLSGYDTMTGYLAMDVLERIGPEAVPSLVHALKGRDKAARSSAARVLGKLGPQAVHAVPDLLEALDDQDPTVYAEVSWALGQIGPAAMPGLVSALRSAERARKLSGVWALGRIGPEAAGAIPVLSELAKDRDKELSQVAVSALKKINPTQQVSS
jgi:HEAT repeat protein